MEMSSAAYANEKHPLPIHTAQDRNPYLMMRLTSSPARRRRHDRFLPFLSRMRKSLCPPPSGHTSLFLVIFQVRQPVKWMVLRWSSYRARISCPLDVFPHARRKWMTTLNVFLTGMTDKASVPGGYSCFTANPAPRDLHPSLTGSSAQLAHRPLNH
ncbi:uncharacterized protein BT62DRAFT_554995 [Guyanagaster necrorhizus]|uniref:Uncharacterized protein n=1 Tax=Guyanagaster necrorhizus TaxID=856835 RepID=A0A9P7VI79_9AGAR|nr:uncharacterized protein BT62DRAFT_554995 [Guyanagaster necrorhizus MCA 3950]KAG7441025.1 hypothetical protein BT62DRAFT_554995 [Guyanagaster necrorhizus MCA 3950]